VVIAYAIWSGLGIIFIALIGLFGSGSRSTFPRSSGSP